MAFVVDASVTLAWLMPDESSNVAEQALELLETQEAVVPSPWWFEVRNALVSAERRHRLDRVQTEGALLRVSQFPIVIDQAPEEGPLLAFARQCGLTVYDAAYLELAQRRRLALATVDRELLAAARSQGVICIEARQ